MGLVVFSVTNIVTAYEDEVISVEVILDEVTSVVPRVYGRPALVSVNCAASPQISR